MSKTSSSRSCAGRDAEDHYSRGLTLLGIADARRRIDALHNHGDVLTVLGRTDEALSAFREMLTGAFRLDLRATGGAAHSKIGRLYRETGRLDEANKHLSAALLLFEEAEDDRGIASSVDDIGKL